MPILIFDEKFKLVFAGNCRKFLEDLILIKAFSDSFFYSLGINTISMNSFICHNS